MDSVVLTDTPGIGIWTYAYQQDLLSRFTIYREVFRRVREKMMPRFRGRAVAAHRLERRRHTWIVLTWYTSGNASNWQLKRTKAGVKHAAALGGIKRRYVHVEQRVVPPSPRLRNQLNYGNLLPSLSGDRIEVELVQPQFGRSIPRRHTAVLREQDFPAELKGGNSQDTLRCRRDHAAAARPAEIHDVWSRAFSGPRARSYRPIVAELVASKRCPVCITEALEEAGTVTMLNGLTFSTGRCPCCQARWMADEPTGWACLDTGQLRYTYRSS